MSELLGVLNNVSLFIDSELDQLDTFTCKNVLFLQVNVSAEDPRNENNASHDSSKTQPNFTEVSINLHSAEPTRDTQDGCATSW